MKFNPLSGMIREPTVLKLAIGLWCTWGDDLYTWLKGLIQPEFVGPVWLTAYQLLVDFQLETKLLGPRLLPQKSWIWNRHEDYDFLQAAAWLGRMIRQVGQAFSLPVKAAYRKPEGPILALSCRFVFLTIVSVEPTGFLQNSFNS